MPVLHCSRTRACGPGRLHDLTVSGHTPASFSQRTHGHGGAGDGISPAKTGNTRNDHAQRGDHRLGHGRPGAGADQRRSGADGRNLGRVDHQPHRHQGAAHRRRRRTAPPPSRSPRPGRRSIRRGSPPRTSTSSSSPPAPPISSSSRKPVSSRPSWAALPGPSISAPPAPGSSTRWPSARSSCRPVCTTGSWSSASTP